MKYIELTAEFEKRVKVDLRLPNVIQSKEIIKFLGENHSRIILDRKRAILITLNLFVVRDLMCSAEYWTFGLLEESVTLYKGVESILHTLGWSEIFDEYYNTALDLLNEFGLEPIIGLTNQISQETGKICGTSAYLKTK